jgi:DNA-binding IclR family transcriptional regulator
MARPSPGVQRVIGLLNFLADHPGQAFSLSDIVRALKFNRATCHSLLAEMVETGYLYRTNDKQYVLGAAAARLGRTASRHLSPLQVAWPEMRALADTYDVVCTAVFRDGRDVVVREHATSVSNLDNRSLVKGARWPLRPPLGTIYFANAPETEAEAWLDALLPTPSDAERRDTKASVAFIREHGFQFVVRNVLERDVEQPAEWLLLPDPAERPIRACTSLEAGQSYQIYGMSAPVFDNRGRVAFVLSLAGFSRSYTGAEVAEMGAQVRAACARISRCFVESPR